MYRYLSQSFPEMFIRSITREEKTECQVLQCRVQHTSSLLLLGAKDTLNESLNNSDRCDGKREATVSDVRCECSYLGRSESRSANQLRGTTEVIRGRERGHGDRERQIEPQRREAKKTGRRERRVKCMEKSSSFLFSSSLHTF